VRGTKGTRGNGKRGKSMSARIVTYVGDTPMEIFCANCNLELKDEDDVCSNGCDEETN
jgi:hypothetical protein